MALRRTYRSGLLAGALFGLALLVLLPDAASLSVAVSAVCAAALLASVATGRIVLPPLEVVATAGPVGHGRPAAVPLPCRQRDPDAAGRPRPRAPGRRPTRRPLPA